MKNNASTAPQPTTIDDLFALAVADPEKFEAFSKEVIDRVINIPGGNRDKLAALQRRLDEKADSGMPRYLSCMCLSDWLDESYQQLARQTGALDCNKDYLPAAG